MAAIIREQVVEERERRNRHAAQEHMRIIDTVIDKTLADRPDAAARLRQTAESKLDAMLKRGETIELSKMRAQSDAAARAPTATLARTPHRHASHRNAIDDNGANNCFCPNWRRLIGRHAISNLAMQATLRSYLPMSDGNSGKLSREPVLGKAVSR